MNIVQQNKDGVVDSVIIRDRQSRKALAHAELHFTVTQLKEFSLFFADKHLDRFTNKKSSRKQ